MKLLFTRRSIYIITALVVALGVAVGATIHSVGTPATAQRANPGDAAIRDLRLLITRTNGSPSAADLTSFETAHKGTKGAALARFLRGYNAAQAKDWQSALNALDAGEISSRTALGDYALLYQGRALANLGRYADAERFLDDVHDKYPDSIVARDGALEAADAALEAGKPDEVFEDLDPLFAKGDGVALVKAADLAVQRGDTKRAVTYYRYAYFYDPASSAGAGALGQLRSLGADPEGTPATEEELAARANKLFEAGKWSDAAAAYGRLLTLHPATKNREQIAVRRVTAAANAKDPVMAGVAVQSVSPANRDLHAEALYQLATAYRKAGQPEQFEATGARLRSLYPSSEATGKFLADYLDMLESRKRMDEAYQIERALVGGYPTNQEGARRSYETAWSLYRGGDYRTAAERFAEHLATYRTPTTKWIGEAAFWAGRSYERLGNPSRALFFYEIARDRYPFGYHGHVATNRIKRLTAAASKPKAEKPEPGSVLDRARINALAVEPVVETADDSVEARFRHTDDFETIGLWDLARGEMEAALAAFPTSPRVALRYAQMFSRKGDNFQATLILRKGYPDVYSYRDDQMPREAWEIMFPLTHWDHIKRVATANGLDPYIVAGLIRQESVFNPRALSRANARGMMQLLPSTGRLVARSEGLGAVGPADLYNPTLNITLGASYLSQQMQKFGRIELAAAAYNAGPGRVVQWRAARSIDPIEEWVENIPFTETRGYVQGVIRYAANYRRLYGNGTERQTEDW